MTTESLWILGQQVYIDISRHQRERLLAAAREHGITDKSGTPSVAMLLQTLAVCAAGGRPVREAAAETGLPYTTWLLHIATEALSPPSPLEQQVARARASLRRTPPGE